MASTPEKIRAALDRNRKKIRALHAHGEDLEWSLANAKARERLAGWVGVRIDSFYTKECLAKIFPIAKGSDFRSVYHYTHHLMFHVSDGYLCCQARYSLPPPPIPLGETAGCGNGVSLGFFATRKEARDFAKDAERRAEIRKWLKKRCRELGINDPFAPREE